MKGREYQYNKEGVIIGFLTPCKCGKMCPESNKYGKPRPPYPGHSNHYGVRSEMEEAAWNRWHHQTEERAPERVPLPVQALLVVLLFLFVMNVLEAWAS